MAKKIIGIYKITCTANGKSYTGQSIDIKRRFNQHKRTPPSRMREDFQNFGVDAFKFEILEECAANELDKKETFYMNENQPDYNIKTEGRGISDEAREKLREMNTGKKRPDISRKVKCFETGEIFESITAAANWCNVPNTNIVMLLKGKGLTAGGYHWEYVNGQPPQHRPEEMRKKVSKPVRCIETGVIYESASKAAEVFGVSYSAISNAAKGLREKSCGCHWEYLTA